MAANHDFVWDQGTDLNINMTYKEGPVGAETVPPDFGPTNYAVRMDIAVPATGNVPSSPLWTFNSEDISNPPNDAGSYVDEPGDADDEIVIGTDGTINITVPRSLTLPGTGGVIYQQMTGASGTTVFTYDIMLRNKQATAKSPNGTQTKLLSGTITVNRSVTLWR